MLNTQKQELLMTLQGLNAFLNSNEPEENTIYQIDFSALVTPEDKKVDSNE